MATWGKGKPWRVVKSLDRLNAQIRAACPRAVPPATPATSWGSIADSAHSTTSDHYPHYYGALGATAVVCARDFPHAPQLGLDIHAIVDRLRQSKDPRIGYLISNRRITGPNYGWQWKPYNGSNPHTTHAHVSSVRTKLADDTRDWQIGLGPPSGGGGFLDMLSDAQQKQLYAWVQELMDRSWADTNRLAAILSNQDAASYQIQGEPERRNEPNKLKPELAAITNRVHTLLTNEDAASYQVLGEPERRTEPNLLKPGLSAIMAELGALRQKVDQLAAQPGQTAAVTD
jgi:hypothetical protein